MVPTTFHGMRSGSARMTRQAATCQPSRGIDRAITMPSGTSIARITAEKNRLRPREARKRPPRSVDGPGRPLSERTPRRKKKVAPGGGQKGPAEIGRRIEQLLEPADTIPEELVVA